MEPSHVTLNGHRVGYRLAGKGSLLVLLHGIAGSSASWEGVIPRLAERHTVLAPDLTGHGSSGKPEGDYSLGAYANVIRDLLDALALPRATFVGHSLGGGVVLQFVYQFPARCARLVLVSSGGLGREVHAVLRAAALPGAEVVLPWLSRAGEQTVGRVVHVLGRLGLHASADLEEAWRGFVTLSEPGARRAFLHTVRGIIDLGGQRVSAADRLHLAAALPTLIVWGAEDPLIPVRHAHDAHAHIPGSRLEVIPDAGHFPHLDAPDRFVDLLLDFVGSTRPATRPRPLPRRPRSSIRPPG